MNTLLVVIKLQLNITTVTFSWKQFCNMPFNVLRLVDVQQRLDSNKDSTSASPSRLNQRHSNASLQSMDSNVTEASCSATSLDFVMGDYELFMRKKAQAATSSYDGAIFFWISTPLNHTTCFVLKLSTSVVVGARDVHCMIILVEWLWIWSKKTKENWRFSAQELQYEHRQHSGALDHQRVPFVRKMGQKLEQSQETTSDLRKYDDGVSTTL